MKSLGNPGRFTLFCIKNVGTSKAKSTQKSRLSMAWIRPRKRKLAIGRLLREFQHRVGDPNEGGSNRHKIMTAYRQDALRGSVATFGITRESPLGGPRYTANPNTLWIRRV